MSYIQKIACEAEKISVPQEVLDLAKDFKVAQSSYGRVQADGEDFYVPVTINGEGFRAKVGDYIISCEGGKKAIVSAEQFAAEFEAIP